MFKFTRSLLCLTLSSTIALTGWSQGTFASTITYQGRLNDTNGPVNGLFDFSFALFPASIGGGQIGTTVLRTSQPVTNGLFTIQLEFPEADSFSGADRWLEIALHPSGVGSNVTLSPRQQITAAPYAIRAATLAGTLPLAQLPAGVVTNGTSDVNLHGAFSGTGAGLTAVAGSAITGALTNSTTGRAFASENEVNIADYGAIPYIPPGFELESYITNRYSLPDNSAAIQAAFDAAYDSHGRSNTVFVPHGIWPIGTNIFVPPGIHVRGVGVLHAGDFGASILLLNSNAFSMLWQTNINRAGLVFNNLDSKGSTMSFIEICGHTNPLAPGVTLAGNMASAPSSTLANGPGVFFGASTVRDWDTTANTGDGYSGDIQVWNSTISGFKLGVRSTANSANYYRMHMVACDIGFATSALCCGADQTVFNNCSAALRPNGIGYDLYSQGGRGMVFISPSDYKIGTWIRATNQQISVIGGNLEFTDAATTRTNFIELWGNPSINMTGTRVSGAHTTFINYGEWAYGGPAGQLLDCSIELPVYNDPTWNAGLPAGWPCLVRGMMYNNGNFHVAGKTEGWLVITDNWPERTTLFTIPLSPRSNFAPPLTQTHYFEAGAWNNYENYMGIYGTPFVWRGGKTTADWMEVYLARTSSGPLAHRRLILGDDTTSTAAAAPNTVTVDGITVNGSGTFTNGIVARTLTTTPDALLLTSDEQTVTVTNSTLLYLSSDSVTASSRSFKLSAGIDGRRLTLIWVNDNAGELLDNTTNSIGSGLAALSADWRPSIWGTLTLMGVGENWVEISRSAN